MRKVLVVLIALIVFTACSEHRKVTIQNIEQDEFAKLNTEQIQLLDVKEYLFQKINANI